MIERIVTNTSPLLALAKMQAFDVIGKAKTLGLITEIKPYIEKAKVGGIFYDDNLIGKFLKSIGE